ncbi:MAG: branched-chain amino acid ABC transporter substrate-binding protein, partial [Proteobacteria bacterium]|nr:branched-chain amino acid ABC transporter substrate-binding protein [Pseudomonadota bacterium]
ENLMKQVASMKDVEIPLLLPGIKLNTSATDFYPIQSMQLQRFEGDTWKLFGNVITSDAG